MSVSSPSPLVAKRGRCYSPAANSKMCTCTTPGTRCLIFLRKCLAIQLQKIGLFPNNLATSCTGGSNFESTVERDAPSYWMYDSGYLIFQGFLEANLKCFWNGALIEAVKVLEFQGYIAPGVLLVSGSPCALEVVRAAWARNVLKPPSNYVITVVGDVEDCLVEPINQGQFTPLPEALCWIILDMTASGQPAVMESICSTLKVAFPDIQKPSRQVVYDTLAKLMSEKKLYQTSNGYFVMTPDKMRLSGLTSSKDDSCDIFTGFPQKQILLSPEEAVVVMHGEIETVRDGNVTHQAIQTNLADVVCGGNSKDKILYPRTPCRIRSGSSAERLERRHSLKFFGHGRRSHSLQRINSVRHIADNEKIHTIKDTSAADELPRKHTSLLSRLFRRSGRVKREESPSSNNKPSFSAQFPPQEWFNRGVTHLHSVGTQTTYLAPSTDMLPKRNFKFDLDDLSFQDMQHKRHISTFGTPRTIRRNSHSATLPRRSFKKKTYSSSSDQNAISRISSQNLVMPCATNDSCTTPCTGSHSSLGSSKTIISKEQSKHASPTPKSLSSASSGYNSLPRSVNNNTRSSKTNVKSNLKSKVKDEPESSITFHVTAKSSSGCDSKESNSLAKTETSATTMTTTINSGNKTKIFVQQHNSPTRSLITFENSTDQKEKPEIIVANRDFRINDSKDGEAGKPTSLCTEQNNLMKSKNKSTKILETPLKKKSSSIETIELEEKSLENISLDKTNNEKSNVNVIDDLSATKNQLSKNLMAFKSETELNNAKSYLLSQHSNVDKINNLKNKNLLKSLNDDDFKMRETINSEPASPSVQHNTPKFNDFKKLNQVNVERELENLQVDDSKLKSYTDFPSLSDLSLRFTSLAAQSILKGVSYNSVDTLVEVNMAAEKKRNCEMSISTDFGVV